MSPESIANSTEKVCHLLIQTDDGVVSYSWQYIFLILILLTVKCHKSKSGRSRSKFGTDVTGLASFFRRLTILCTPTVVWDLNSIKRSGGDPSLIRFFRKDLRVVCLGLCQGTISVWRVSSMITLCHIYNILHVLSGTIRNTGANSCPHTHTPITCFNNPVTIDMPSYPCYYKIYTCILIHHLKIPPFHQGPIMSTSLTSFSTETRWYTWFFLYTQTLTNFRSLKRRAKWRGRNRRRVDDRTAKRRPFYTVRRSDASLVSIPA
jgi:hypothetical protein